MLNLVYILTESYGKEIFLSSELLELVHFWYRTPTNVRWSLNPFAQHIQEADGEVGGDSRRGEGRSWGRGGWLWHWLHHLMCWKGSVVVTARTCCWLMPPGHIAEMAQMTLVGNVALTMEAPTGNPRLSRLLSSSLSHTHRSMADPITSWYCYRYAGTSQAFHFLFLNAVISKFLSGKKSGNFLKLLFDGNAPHTHISTSNVNTRML